MWYYYLNREQCYLRSYRTHNLWLDMYMKKIRTPRVHNFHIGIFKRLAKTYSGVNITHLSSNHSFIVKSHGLHLGSHLRRSHQVLHTIQEEARRKLKRGRSLQQITFCFPKEQIWLPYSYLRRFRSLLGGRSQ